MPKRSYLYFTTVFAQALCEEITGSMPSSHSLAILAILDFSRHLDTCFKLTTMMQTSVLYNWLLPFRGLLGSFEALIEKPVEGFSVRSSLPVAVFGSIADMEEWGLTIRIQIQREFKFKFTTNLRF